MLVLGVNQARDVSLNTSIVTHQSSNEMQRTNSFYPVLFCFLFCFLCFLFFLFLGLKLPLFFSITTTQTKVLLHTAPSKSDQHLEFQTAGRESQALLRIAQKEFGSKVRSVGKNTR